MVFVSCFKESKKAPAMAQIARSRPDVFIWMGDNIYGDSEDMAVLRKKYQVAASNPDYVKIQDNARVIGTWDDHDFGKNDVGREFAKKRESQQEFLDFLKVAPDSPRRKREGVYAKHDFGPQGRQVRVILLDTRYHREAIGSNGIILGEEQWRWLERSLRESPAEVNLLVSSIQVLPSEHRFEKWADFPEEKARLLALLAEEEVPPVLILSGDRHLGEISLKDQGSSYPLYEVTSSSLNSSFGGNSKELNRLRVGENFGRNNFGMLTLSWEGNFPVIEAAVCDENGKKVLKAKFSLQKSSPK
ncbi:alkaline phosphatase D family protein [Roseibacillus persicicus]|uniref:alkaline phosphatase D family protein n=1 Tax=Roseibacillus persicicus TaxID=454148 RepID=UPI00398AD007